MEKGVYIICVQVTQTEYHTTATQPGLLEDSLIHFLCAAAHTNWIGPRTEHIHN